MKQELKLNIMKQLSIEEQIKRIDIAINIMEQAKILILSHSETQNISDNESQSKVCEYCGSDNVEESVGDFKICKTCWPG